MNVSFKIIVFLAIVLVQSFAASIDKNNPTITCGENEILNHQASPCVVHCVQRHITSCPGPTKPACECKDLHIRRTADGPCIPYSECRFLNPE